MSKDLFTNYRNIYEQGFLPIFTEDGFETEMLIEASIEAGLKVLEYTLRRKDSVHVVPALIKKYPELTILVGSTLDNEIITVQRKKEYPQLLTISQLNSLGVDGYVSMLGWSRESLEKYSQKKIIIPFAMTPNEAFSQVSHGAQFIKMFGSDLEIVKRCRQVASFDYCPIMVTGGMTVERIPFAIAAGAVLIGSGFDLILKEKSMTINSKEVATVLKSYVAAVKTAREEKYPAMIDMASMSREQWLSILPNYHPFDTCSYNYSN